MTRDDEANVQSRSADHEEHRVRWRHVKVSSHLNPTKKKASTAICGVLAIIKITIVVQVFTKLPGQSLCPTSFTSSQAYSPFSISNVYIPLEYKIFSRQGSQRLAIIIPATEFFVTIFSAAFDQDTPKNNIRGAQPNLSIDFVSLTRVENL